MCYPRRRNFDAVSAEPMPYDTPIDSDDAPEVDESLAKSPPPKQGPWGPWMTIALSLVVGAGLIVASIFAAIFVTAANVLIDPNYSPLRESNAMATNGLFASLSMVFSMIIAVTLILCFVALRNGPTIREYLALRMPTIGQAFVWTGAFVLFLIVTNYATESVQTEVAPDFMSKIYKTAGFLPLLVFALVFAAPVYEELLFRGFLYAGLRQTRLGASGTALTTAAVFASLHLQYDAFGMGVVFLVGVLLAVIRERTGSAILCMWLHGLMNLLATLTVAQMVAEGQ